MDTSPPTKMSAHDLLNGSSGDANKVTLDASSGVVTRRMILHIPPSPAQIGFKLLHCKLRESIVTIIGHVMRSSAAYKSGFHRFDFIMLPLDVALSNIKNSRKNREVCNLPVCRYPGIHQEIRKLQKAKHKKRKQAAKHSNKDSLIDLSGTHQEKDIIYSSLTSFGTIVDVPGDGHCGYHSLQVCLLDLGIIQSFIPMEIFRKMVHDHCSECFITLLGNPSTEPPTLPKYVDQDGKPGYLVHSNTCSTLADFFVNNVVNHIWDEDTDFTCIARKQHWIDSYIFPIIVLMYDASIVIYVKQQVLVDNLTSQYYSTV